jgi:hypothetical protein
VPRLLCGAPGEVQAFDLSATSMNDYCGARVPDDGGPPRSRLVAWRCSAAATGDTASPQLEGLAFNVAWRWHFSHAERTAGLLFPQEFAVEAEQILKVAHGISTGT